MIKLYDLALSGNAHKCRLLLSMLGVEYESVPVDFAKGEHKAPEYLAVNPFGQVPALTDGDVTLRDSGAILIYLAGKYGAGDWLPSAPNELAEIVSWLSFSANEINNGMTLARFAVAFKGPGIDIATAQRRGGRALKLLDAHLEGREWLALGRPSLAEFVCHPLVSVWRDAELDIADYPATAAWLERFQALPGWTEPEAMLAGMSGG